MPEISELPQEAPPTELEQFYKDETENFLKFEVAREKMDCLIADWQKEVEATKTRRLQRNIEVDVRKLQNEGKLPENETFIPRRVIDSNIRKERPKFLNFLVQARRILIFEPQDIPDSAKTQRLEAEFTTGMRYPGWEIPFDKVLDGGAAHGWDWVEVEFDETKPLNVGIDHIGHENIIIPVTAMSLQACERIGRSYDFTVPKLINAMQKYGFSSEEGLRLIVDARQKKQHTIRVYKFFCKYNGIVYVKWYAGKESQTWLKAPVPLFMGRKELKVTTEWVDQPSVQADIMTGEPVVTMIKTPQQVSTWVNMQETMYPIFLLPYQQTEQQCILDMKGRCHIDSGDQETMTALNSIFVNGTVTAGHVFASPKNTDPTLGTAIKKLDTTLEHNCIYNVGMDFFSPPYPPVDLLRALQMIDTQNQSENGQVAFAAINRQDSRKTATEVSAAQQQNALLSTVDVILFSIFVREVYSYCWLIVQSLALQGLVKLCQIPSGIDPMGQPVMQNDTQFLKQSFFTKTAGDVDVIQRAEKMQRRLQFWPIVAQAAATAPAVQMLAATFFMDMVKEAFPDEAQKYETLVIQGLTNVQSQPAIQESSGPTGTEESGQASSGELPSQGAVAA